MTFQRHLFDAGLAGLTVPREYGGQGLTRRHVEIFNEEAVDFYLPIGLYTITIGMCVPVLLEHGTDEQRRRHIPNMLAGHEIWCQMFSEPNAGSDVASLQMRAVRDGDEWVINGQKVWTSSAHYASYGMCVTRTDVDVPKHQGLTMIIVPMDAPGVTVRPLIQATGDHGFNEVFCDDVRVPLDNVVGDVNTGWRVALSMLMNERVALGASGNSLVSGRADVLIEAAKALGATTHPVMRQALIDVYVREQVLRYVALRVPRPSNPVALRAPRARSPNSPDPSSCAGPRACTSSSSRCAAAHGSRVTTTRARPSAPSSTHRRSRLPAAPPRCNETSSVNVFSGCRRTSRPTAACPSKTCS